MSCDDVSTSALKLICEKKEKARASRMLTLIGRSVSAIAACSG